MNDESRKLAADLAAPFDPADLKCKPRVIRNNQALAVVYVDARVIQDRLDSVFGPGGWQDAYRVLADGSVVCELSARIGGEWVKKTDVGSPSEQPDAGDRCKAAFSDALKRAAVKFGVGRYIYALPQFWLPYDTQRKQFTAFPTLPAWAVPEGWAPARREESRPVGQADRKALPAKPEGIEEFRALMGKAGKKWPDVVAYLRNVEKIDVPDGLKFSELSAATLGKLRAWLSDLVRRAERSPANLAPTPEELQEMGYRILGGADGWEMFLYDEFNQCSPDMVGAMNDRERLAVKAALARRQHAAGREQPAPY